MTIFEIITISITTMGLLATFGVFFRMGGAFAKMNNIERMLVGVDNRLECIENDVKKLSPRVSYIEGILEGSNY